MPSRWEPSRVDPTAHYGRQPFMDLLREDRRSVRWFGERLGFEGPYVGRVGYGRVPPSDEFREAVALYFGKPVGELFTTAALRARYKPWPNQRPTGRPVGETT